jgi:hypothetical protein
VLTFVETTVFTSILTGLVDDDTYAEFQKHLARNPESGDLLSGCGGVRKVRMALSGKGKSGGARVCYLFLKHKNVIYLLYVFTKGDADTLTAGGKATMRTLAQQIRDEFS